MIFIYISTLSHGKNRTAPFRIAFKYGEASEVDIFNIRPEIEIPKKHYQTNHLNKERLNSAPAFYDLADELIEILQGRTLVFVDVLQFQILKGLFTGIGYNFNTRPKYLFYGPATATDNDIASHLIIETNYNKYSTSYAIAFVTLMQTYLDQLADRKKRISVLDVPPKFILASYQGAPGIYYFLDEMKEVIYVGKAKNIRKRLHSHFSSPSTSNNIDYSKVKHINVEYCGHDIIAQLMESAAIKALQPIYNTQQVVDPVPYIITKGKTAKGIIKLQIIRKTVKNTMPEKYFNRQSVRLALDHFCTTYQLCRKHCGLENVKGPCSNVSLKKLPCVCAGDISIESYNERFEIAFYNFQKHKTRKIYKLKGRTPHEDAFVYLVNGIYEGYGFIDKDLPVESVEDILGHLCLQNNNYDTSRIVSHLDKTVLMENILDISGT